MLERDRLVIREHLAEVAAEAKAEQERVNAPIRKAEADLKATHAELAKVYISRLRGEVPDPDRFVSPEVASVRMSKKQAAEYTAEQWRTFLSQHSEVYVCTELFDAFDQYFIRNGIHIITAEMFSRLIQRFAEYGLLPERPAPAPELEPTPEPAVAAEPELIDGWDLESGEPRQYTQRELDRLSSTDYRKALHLYADAFQLPTRGPGPTGYAR